MAQGKQQHKWDVVPWTSATTALESIQTTHSAWEWIACSAGSNTRCTVFVSFLFSDSVFVVADAMVVIVVCFKITDTGPAASVGVTFATVAASFSGWVVWRVPAAENSFAVGADFVGAVRVTLGIATSASRCAPIGFTQPSGIF